MAQKDTFSLAEKKIIFQALELMKSEVKKIWIKSEKLGLEEAGELKKTFLEVETLRGKISE